MNMDMNKRTRKWQITINNPLEKGYTHECIKNILAQYKGCVYWCLSDEVGLNENTFHTHIYLCCKNTVKFSVMFERFKGAHFEMARGTSSQNRDYVFKEGKWSSNEKVETNIKDSHEEWGELPIERQGERNDLNDLYNMIKEGLSNAEILEQSPQYLLHLDKIERCRQVVIEDKYKSTWRDLDVTYIYGDTGTGKTRGVMEKYGYENVFRVTDYNHPFDSYKGQDVVVFEEFRSSLKISEMLNYLDGYPCELRCRYSNKIACFTKVYIISNISLREQYTELQFAQKLTWNAFLRRINYVVIHQDDNIFNFTCDEYINGFIPTKHGEKIFA